MAGRFPQVYIFGWPSFLGGADTKVAHLLRLLHDRVDLTCIPNDERHLHDETWTRALDDLAVRYSTLDALPTKLDGVALAICNDVFFTGGLAGRAKERGLKVVWSSGMMWHHRGELEAVGAGLVDMVLYVSEFQRAALEPGYWSVRQDLPSAVTGNYIDPALFPVAARKPGPFTIGRLSRPDPLKYPEDFPVFYERLELPETRFRVMAWDEALSHKYRWHRFDERWDLLPAGRESASSFLQSLDVFVYPLGHDFRESWGRSTVEAMLSGAVPLVPRGHQFEELLADGETGFICRDFLEWKERARQLWRDPALRGAMAARARTHAAAELCNADVHRKTWLAVLDRGGN
jgi:hypothetical protein